MKNDPQFMLLFRFEPNFEFQPSQEDLAEIHNQWVEFIGQVALKEKLVHTHQLGFDGRLLNPDKGVTENIVIAENQTIGGNMVIRAHSIEEATEIAKGSPILRMGGTVEIRNIMPMA